MPRGPGRRVSAHEEAVTRRLALLDAELTAVRSGEPLDGGRSELDEHTRVRRGPDPFDPGSVEVWTPLVPPVPLVGRHASRGRVVLLPWHLAVVTALVAAGLVFTAWWAWGGDSDATGLPPALQTAAPLVSATPSPGSGTPASAVPSGSSSGTTVTVDVAGKVRRPGIAVLPAGSRVVDALEAAGGSRPGVDLSSLNLARVLVDGEQVLVGVTPPTGAAAGATGVPPVASLVNLNTADQVALESLPEVGPVTAQAIVAYRAEIGGFTSVDQLLDVDGIGEATLAKIAPYVTL